VFFKKKYSYLTMLYTYFKLVPGTVIFKVLVNTIRAIIPTVNIIITAQFLDAAVIAVADKKLSGVIFPLCLIIVINLFNFYIDILIDLINTKAENKIRKIVTPKLAEKKASIKRDIFDLIKEFGDSVKGIDSVDKIMNLENELSESYFLRKLNYITNARFNTKSFFEYLQWPNKYVDLMNDIYREWIIVKNLFIKFILSNELNLIPQISRQLHEIAILEKDLCNTIIKEET